MAAPEESCYGKLLSTRGIRLLLSGASQSQHTDTWGWIILYDESTSCALKDVR